MEITIAKYHGFCSGVKNAINIVINTRRNYPNKKIYLLNKLVHNQSVMNYLMSFNIEILDDERSMEDKINSIDDGIIIFSAHGHDKKLDILCKNKKLQIVDAICPRVNINLNSIKETLKEGKNVIYIGIEKHPETIASLSIDKNIYFIDFKNPNIDDLPYLENATIHNQTTLIQSSLDKIYDLISKKVKDLKIVNDICYSTSNRQNSLNEVTNEDLIIIIGDKISSNSTRLFEVAKQKFPHLDVYQVSNLNELKEIDISQNKKGFITAGASTPDLVINPIIEYLKSI